MFVDRHKPPYRLAGAVFLVLVAIAASFLNLQFRGEPVRQSHLTVMSLAEQVDPIKLNATLTATAEATTGLGERFGDCLINANRIMDDLTPRMPQIRAATQGVADLADVYAKPPDLLDGLENAATTAHTQPPAGKHRRRTDGGDRIQQHGRRQLRARRTVLRPCRGRSAADDQTARRLPGHDLLHRPQLRRGGAKALQSSWRRQRLRAQVFWDHTVAG